MCFWNFCAILIKGFQYSGVQNTHIKSSVLLVRSEAFGNAAKEDCPSLDPLRYGRGRVPDYSFFQRFSLNNIRIDRVSIHI